MHKINPERKGYVATDIFVLFVSKIIDSPETCQSSAQFKLQPKVNQYNKFKWKLLHNSRTSNLILFSAIKKHRYKYIHLSYTLGSLLFLLVLICFYFATLHAYFHVLNIRAFAI